MQKVLEDPEALSLFRFTTRILSLEIAQMPLLPCNLELWRITVPLDRVSVLLGHKSVGITERHHVPWLRSRQEQLEADMRRTRGRQKSGGHVQGTRAKRGLYFIEAKTRNVVLEGE